MVRRFDFLAPVSGRAQSHLHVGLPAAQPHISHQHVVEFNVLRPVNDDGVWSTRRGRLDRDGPTTIVLGHCLHRVFERW